MKFFLQFGYGMLAHSKHLISKWGEGTVILSPRDMTLEQIKALPKDIAKYGGKALFDPQLFAPHCTHHGLGKFDYWPTNFNTIDFFTSQKCRETIEKIAEINAIAQTDEMILPGLFCDKVTSKWLDYHTKIVNIGKEYASARLATICLSAEVVRSEEQISKLLNTIFDWDVQGVYLIAAHPFNEYLVDDPVWMSNLLHIGAAIKLQRKKLIVGYATHQFLPFACVGADAIASGTWLNVRMFSTNKFDEPEEGSVAKRKTWYYCPQTLSEYQTTALTMAYNKKKLEVFAPANSMNSDYANILFDVAPPDAVKFDEQKAFRHYLTCFRSQCKQLSNMSYEETYRQMELMLNVVSENLRTASRLGVRGRDRDFSNAIDATKTAIVELNREFEIQLSMLM